MGLPPSPLTPVQVGRFCALSVCTLRSWQPNAVTQLLAPCRQEPRHPARVGSQEGFVTQWELLAISSSIWFPVRSQRIYEANWTSFWSCLYQNFPRGLLEHGPGVAS